MSSIQQFHFVVREQRIHVERESRLRELLDEVAECLQITTSTGKLTFNYSQGVVGYVHFEERQKLTPQ